MCVLLALRRDGRLWIGANRDERLDRAWLPPRELVSDPPVWGGLDLEGGGSWLAVNLAGGFVVGVTNARLGARPGQRSRGRLVLEVAAERTLPDAVALVSELDLSLYGAFNLLLASPRAVWVASNAPEASVSHADGAVTVLGNEPLASESPRVRGAADRLRSLAGDGAVSCEGVAELLTDHDGEDPLCRHGDRFGTVSSSVLCIGPGGAVDYGFAPGRPCTTAFAPVPLPPTSGS